MVYHLSNETHSEVKSTNGMAKTSHSVKLITRSFSNTINHLDLIKQHYEKYDNLKYFYLNIFKRFFFIFHFDNKNQTLLKRDWRSIQFETSIKSDFVTTNLLATSYLNRLILDFKVMHVNCAAMKLYYRPFHVVFF